MINQRYLVFCLYTCYNSVTIPKDDNKDTVICKRLYQEQYA